MKSSPLRIRGLTSAHLDHRLIQSIAHPTISVWAVDVLPNGDIVSGASDATIRVWSKATERRASLEQREKLERDLRTRALNKSQVGDVNMTDLPGREALGRPGKHWSSSMMEHVQLSRAPYRKKRGTSHHDQKRRQSRSLSVVVRVDNMATNR